MLIEFAHLTWQILVASDGEYGKEACCAFESIYDGVKGEAAILIKQLLEFRR